MWNVIPNIINTATNVSMSKTAIKRHYVILTHESEETIWKSKVKLFLNKKNTLLLYNNILFIYFITYVCFSNTHFLRLFYLLCILLLNL